MLVISRRKGQRITIGDDIELIVTELHRSSVKVGIKAPRGYAVLRGEIRDSIEDANREAAASVLDEGSLLDDELKTAAVQVAVPRPSPAAVFLEARQSAGTTSRQKKDAPGPEVIVRRRPPAVPTTVEGLNSEPVEIG